MPLLKSPRSSLLIAFFVAVVGFLMYFSQTEINPITGKKQHLFITPKQEMQLGLQAVPQITAKMGGEVPSSDPRTQTVRRIGRQIVEHSQAKQGPWHFQFHLLADRHTLNAFALPGGQIFITLGLLNQLQNEAQLAGVLAHEIGHVIERHSAQQMAKSQLGQILVMATGIGANDPQRSHQGQAAAIASVVNQITQLRYSRKDELEADQWGLTLMSQAGYQPAAMLDVMHILAKAVPEKHALAFLQTHPHPKQRIEFIQTYLHKHPSYQHLSYGRPLQQLFHLIPS